MSFNYFTLYPNDKGYFGEYGGAYIAETTVPFIEELKQEYNLIKNDPEFHQQFNYYLKHYVGRPSPLYFAENLTTKLGGAKIYFKRDELNHTGAHKINNCIGQVLLAQRMGKNRIIAETGAGQHGVATATVCARFGIKCIIYMGEKDMERQRLNVFRMKLLGAEVVPVTQGSRTLKDAVNEALRDLVANPDNTYYLLGSAVGPHPYPTMVRDFQSIIGREAREQILEAEKRLPDILIAAVGGGSNAIGLFHPFIEDKNVNMIAVEGGGKGTDTNYHAATMSRKKYGVFHGYSSYILSDNDGQIQRAHSISAGLDYPAIGPEHAWLSDIDRVEYVSAIDDEALEAFQICSRTEGIIPALEPSHAIAHAMKIVPGLPKDNIIIVNLCGRGDKDVAQVCDILDNTK